MKRVRPIKSSCDISHFLFVFLLWKTFDVSERTNCVDDDDEEMMESYHSAHLMTMIGSWKWNEACAEDHLPRPPDWAAGRGLGWRTLHGVGVAAVAAGQGRLRAPAHGLLLELVSVGDGVGRVRRAVGADGQSGGGRDGSRSQRGGSIQAVECVAEVGHEPGAESDIDTRNGGQGDGHFAGALGESGAEAVAGHDRIGRQTALTAQFVQVANGELQDVGLLQLGHAGLAVLGGQSAGHQIFQLIQAPVDSGAALSFQQWLGNL